MATDVPLTIQLLALIGLYELAAGVAGFTGRINWQRLIEDFERSPSLTFVTGFVVFAFGGMLTIVHNHWTDLPAVVVSAIGWIALVEGLLIMTIPGPLLALSRSLVRNQRAISILAMLFGLALIILGLTSHIEATLY